MSFFQEMFRIARSMRVYVPSRESSNYVCFSIDICFSIYVCFNTYSVSRCNSYSHNYVCSIIARTRITISKVKGKVCFHVPKYPVRWTAQGTLHFTPWQTCSFRHQVDFSGKHSAILQLLHEYYSLTFPLPSIATYSSIQLSELGHRGENENDQASKQQRRDSNAGSLECMPGILPLSYRAPLSVFQYVVPNHTII